MREYRDKGYNTGREPMVFEQVEDGVKTITAY